jgi:Flp pilus assembly protein TadD
MSGMRIKTYVVLAVVTAVCSQYASGRDGMRITLPRRSELTPVQKLNRQGVDAVKRHQYDKAGALFYKAYLFDPTDPFTLNNLGYIAEMQGQLERANKFYDLSSKQGSNADIDMSNAKGLQGRPMKAAFENLQDIPMRVNRINVNAVQLLSQSRGFEATTLLQSALSLDPKNAFTLNNMGVAHESIGDYQNALKYYGQAADVNSTEPVVVTLTEGWRGRPVSKMAAESAKRLEKHLRTMDQAEAQSIMFTMHGVSAVNQNDWQSARQDFLKAYSLHPESAFSLNNRGYVAEHDGDLETAQYFYEKARRASDSGTRVGMATQRSAEGKNLVTVADDSNQKVDRQLEQYSQQRRRETGPIELTPRDGTQPQEEKQPPSTEPPVAPQSVPQ